MAEVTNMEEALVEIQRLKDWNLKFFKRVQYMRAMQKEYFKTRSRESLQKSCAVESEIDGIISSLQARLDERNAREAEADPRFREVKKAVEDLFDGIEQ